MLAALKARAAETGLRRLIVSVRPIGKEAEPEVPMAEYVARRRTDGLFADRWLRTRGAERLVRAPDGPVTEVTRYRHGPLLATGGVGRQRPAR